VILDLSDGIWLGRVFQFFLEHIKIPNDTSCTWTQSKTELQTIEVMYNIIYFMLVYPIVCYWHFMGFILGLCITHVNQNVFGAFQRPRIM